MQPFDKHIATTLLGSCLPAGADSSLNRFGPMSADRACQQGHWVVLSLAVSAR